MSTLLIDEVNVRNAYVAAELKISLEDLVKYYPSEFIDSKMLTIKINQFISAKRLDLTKEIQKAEASLTYEPPIEQPQPTNLKELSASLYWTYYYLVKGRLAVSAAKMAVVVSDMIIQSNQLRQEHQISTGGEPLQLV